MKSHNYLFEFFGEKKKNWITELLDKIWFHWKRTELQELNAEKMSELISRNSEKSQLPFYFLNRVETGLCSKPF